MKDYETVQIRIAAIVDLLVAASRVEQGLARIPNHTDARLITGASLITLGELRALMRAIRAVDPRKRG